MRRNIMNSNLFWCIVGIIGGAIFSLLISLFFYFKGLNKKRLTYDIKTFCIISDKINQIIGLDVKYNSTEIENLYSSTVTIKNIGNSIIEKDDFAPSCPISISTDGKFLVDESNGMNLFPLNKANNVYPLFETNSDNTKNNKITIAFDYISKKEELTCSLFHTGNISFTGVLKDGKIISPDENRARKKRNSLIYQIFLVLIGIIISLISTFISHGGATR